VTRGDGCISGTKAPAFTTVVRRLKEMDDGSAAWTALKEKERNWRVRRKERARPRGD